MTLYEILDVAKDASTTEIKKAYRRAARKMHPDLGGKSEDMARLAKAYKVLVDPAKRAFYDETGQEEPDSPIDIQARGMLIDSFLQQMEQLSEGEDIIEEVAAHWHHERRRWDAMMAEQKAKIERYERQIKRIVLEDTDGENVLAAALRSQIDGMQEIIRKNAGPRKAMDRVIEMLASYKYNEAKPKPRKTATINFYA